MIGLIIVGSIYFILLDAFSFIFSIRLCGTISSSTSDNFECGFYSILTSSLRYRFNYWMIIIHFLIFEQELILALLWIFSITINLNSNHSCLLLLSILFIELLLYFIFITFLSFAEFINYWLILFLFNYCYLLIVFNYLLLTQLL